MVKKLGNGLEIEIYKICAQNIGCDGLCEFFENEHLKKKKFCKIFLIYRAVSGSDQWRVLRYFYQYFLARTIKQIVHHHRNILLSDEIIQRYNLDVNAIFSAMSLVTFDEFYTRYAVFCFFYCADSRFFVTNKFAFRRRIYNFSTLVDYYKWSSAVNYLHGIKVPMIFINALDDPLLSDVLHSPVREFAGKYWQLSTS